MNKEVIDMADVMERVQDDMELLIELLDIFEGDFIEKRKKIDGFVQEGDWEQLRDLAHSLKGAAGNISAKGLFTTCFDLEKKAESQQLEDVGGLLLTLDSQFEELLASIKDIKANSK